MSKGMYDEFVTRNGIYGNLPTVPAIAFFNNFRKKKFSIYIIRSRRKLQIVLE